MNCIAILLHLATYTFAMVDERCLYWPHSFTCIFSSFSSLVLTATQGTACDRFLWFDNIANRQDTGEDAHEV